MDSIYVISSIHVEDSGCVTRKRTVGWFSTLAKALNVVTNNEGDIYEANHYNHCVIEEVQAGLYPSIGKKECQEWWFKWVDGRYSHVHKPPVQEIISGNSSCIGKRVNGSNIE